MPPRLCKDTLSRAVGQIRPESPFAIFASPYSIVVMIMRMAISDGHGRLPLRPRLFPAVLWLALTMIVACALLPLGPPLSKALGSAFSPATSIVTISITFPRLRAPEKKLVPPDDGPSVSRSTFAHDPFHADFSPARSAAPFRTIIATPFAAMEVTQPMERRRPGAVFARGPPLDR